MRNSESGRPNNSVTQLPSPVLNREEKKCVLNRKKCSEQKTPAGPKAKSESPETLVRRNCRQMPY